LTCPNDATPRPTMSAEGFLTIEPDRVTLTRDGLLRVDSLLPRFFKPEHAAVRYT
jgi:oxygen-independent coproporphyrinogen III oxidase